MTDAIEPLSGTGTAADTILDYSTSVDETSKNQRISEQMDVAMERALERALSDPLAMGATEKDQNLLDGNKQLEVTELKTELVSEPKTNETPSEAESTLDVANEVASVLRDLTEWQVTWNVAQTAQKDMTHILKSG